MTIPIVSDDDPALANDPLDPEVRGESARGRGLG